MGALRRGAGRGYGASVTASSQAVWGRWVASTLAGSALWACVACGTGGASGGSHDTVPSPDGGDGGAPTTDLDADLHGDLGRAGDATSSPDALEVAGGADGAGRPPSEDVSGAAADAPRAWTAVVADLPGAALGGWRAPGGDVWVVGARGAGQVPLLLRRAAGVWSWMDPGVEADLWAVHGASDARVWLAGAAGTLVARDASGGGTVAVATGVTGTLRALWVATD